MTLNNNRQGEQSAADVAPLRDERFTATATAPAPEAPHVENQPGGAPAPEPSSVERAEQIADRLGERCAEVTSACVRKLAWLTARAREAVQDLWAEAQSVRNKDQS
jgi:hypothetical protein